eukprot:133047-Alexandrium_andersonii.AAC.1
MGGAPRSRPECAAPWAPRARPPPQHSAARAACPAAVPRTNWPPRLQEDRVVRTPRQVHRSGGRPRPRT